MFELERRPLEFEPGPLTFFCRGGWKSLAAEYLLQHVCRLWRDLKLNDHGDPAPTGVALRGDAALACSPHIHNCRNEQTWVTEPVENPCRRIDPGTHERVRYRRLLRQS